MKDAKLKDVKIKDVRELVYERMRAVPMVKDMVPKRRGSAARSMIIGLAIVGVLAAVGWMMRDRLQRERELREAEVS